MSGYCVHGSGNTGCVPCALENQAAEVRGFLEQEHKDRILFGRAAPWRPSWVEEADVTVSEQKFYGYEAPSTIGVLAIAVSVAFAAGMFAGYLLWSFIG